MVNIEETPEGFSLKLQCSNEAEVRSLLRKYLCYAQKMSDLFEEVQKSIEKENMEILGVVKVALAYRMTAEHDLNQAWDGIDVAKGILSGEINPQTTRFRDLLTSESE